MAYFTTGVEVYPESFETYELTLELARRGCKGEPYLAEDLLRWADQMPATSNMAIEMRRWARVLLPPLKVSADYERAA